MKSLTICEKFSSNSNSRSLYVKVYKRLLFQLNTSFKRRSNDNKIEIHLFTLFEIIKLYVILFC